MSKYVVGHSQYRDLYAVRFDGDMICDRMTRGEAVRIAQLLNRHGMVGGRQR